MIISYVNYMNTTVVALLLSFSYVFFIYCTISFYLELIDLRKKDNTLKQRLSFESIMKKKHRKKEKAFRRENKELKIKYREVVHLYTSLYFDSKEYLNCKLTMKAFEKKFRTKYKIWNMK